MKVLVLSLFIAFAIAAPLEANNDPIELIVNGHPQGEPLEVSDIVDLKVKQLNDGEVVKVSNPLHSLTAAGLAEAAAAEENKVENIPVAQPAPVEAVIIAEPVVLPAPVAPEVVPEPIVLPVPAKPEVVPEPIVLPVPAKPEVVPEPTVLPVPAKPEVVLEPIVLPVPAKPEVVPEPIVLPVPAKPEVVPEPIVLPVPAKPEVVPEPIVLPAPAVPEVQEPVPAAPAPQGEIYNDGIVSITLNTAQAAVASTVQYLQSWYTVVINYFYNGQEVAQQAL